jgi:tRNA acetyltransferase TAN1
LIITCARHLETETKEEIKGILEIIGDTQPTIIITEMSGILIAKTILDSIMIVNKIREIILEEPWKIRYCLRIIPIQKNTDTSIESIEKAVFDLIRFIEKSESYRIMIEKRNSNISSKELISKIAGKISNKVSLESPDKIILIEILGNKAGISIVKDIDILSMEKIKRNNSE